MKKFGGFDQDKLTDIWITLSGDNPDPLAKKVIDDDIEQVMTINTTDGQVSANKRGRRD